MALPKQTASRAGCEASQGWFAVIQFALFEATFVLLLLRGQVGSLA